MNNSMRTTYSTAVNWLHNNYVQIDADKLFTICQNAGDYEFGYIEENEDGYTPDIFQYFLTDANNSDVNYLKKTFPDLIFQYCEALGMWVLMVDHCGTSWKYVGCDVASAEWWEMNKNKYNYEILTKL